MTRKIVALIASAVLSSTTALASAPVAQVHNVSGKVLVNQGEGFVPASEGLSLKHGDKVFVGKDAAASIDYLAANCSVDVASSSVVAIQDKAPCAEGENVAAVDSVFVNAAATGGGGGYATFVIPTFIVGTGAIFTAAVIHQHRHRNRPVSSP